MFAVGVQDGQRALRLIVAVPAYPTPARPTAMPTRVAMPPFSTR